MKSLYPKGKGKIHPSPSCPGGQSGGGGADAVAVLSLLPAAILALTAALRAEDREVLAYLVTRSLQGPWSVLAEEKRRCWRLGHHQPMLSCGCFECYTSYWFRWDSSPDRELIHQAIEAFEEHLASSEKRQPAGKGGRRKEKRKGKAEEKGKEKRKPEKEKDKVASGGGAVVPVFDRTAEVMGSCREGEDEEEAAEAETVYNAELVLEEEVGGGCGDEAEGEGEAEAEADADGLGMEAVAVPQQLHGGERRRGWADVMGLFNSRFWSLWSPAV